MDTLYVNSEKTANEIFKHEVVISKEIYYNYGSKLLSRNVQVEISHSQIAKIDNIIKHIESNHIKEDEHKVVFVTDNKFDSDKSYYLISTKDKKLFRYKIGYWPLRMTLLQYKNQIYTKIDRLNRVELPRHYIQSNDVLFTIACYLLNNIYNYTQLLTPEHQSFVIDTTVNDIKHMGEFLDISNEVIDACINLISIYNKWIDIYKNNLCLQEMIGISNIRRSLYLKAKPYRTILERVVAV